MSYPCPLTFLNLDTDALHGSSCHAVDDPDGWAEADRRAARHRAAKPAPTYAKEGEYPTPETEHGKELSARLRNHGLDFDRSIVNIEREAKAGRLPR